MVRDGPEEIGFAIGVALGFAWWIYTQWGVRARGGSAGWYFAMVYGGIGWLVGPYVAKLTAYLTGG